MCLLNNDEIDEIRKFLEIKDSDYKKDGSITLHEFLNLNEDLGIQVHTVQQMKILLHYLSHYPKFKKWSSDDLERLKSLPYGEETVVFNDFSCGDSFVALIDNVIVYDFSEIVFPNNDIRDEVEADKANKEIRNKIENNEVIEEDVEEDESTEEDEDTSLLDISIKFRERLNTLLEGKLCWIDVEYNKSHFVEFVSSDIVCSDDINHEELFKGVFDFASEYVGLVIKVSKANYDILTDSFNVSFILTFER